MFLLWRMGGRFILSVANVRTSCRKVVVRFPNN